jgi:hypothetical protein
MHPIIYHLRHAQLHTKKICTQATFVHILYILYNFTKKNMHPYILDITLLKKNYAPYML